MNGCAWIVCEATSRWAAALRLAARRDERLRPGGVRLYETRRLGDLTSRLAERPDAFAAVEVRHDNLGDALTWLSWAERRFGRARLVALLDRSLLPGQPEVGDVLREAGALVVATSPRQLQAIVELFQQHAALAAAVAGSFAAHLPLEEQVWRSLPWQAEQTRVG
jgi:hypothetical protein